MPNRRVDPRDFLPLTPAIAHILLALADENRHGYAIMQEIERMTDGAVRMGPGTLYGTVKRMLASRLIEEVDEARGTGGGPQGGGPRGGGPRGGGPRGADTDERRRYYRATALGTSVLAAETERMAALLGAARAKRVRAR